VFFFFFLNFLFTRHQLPRNVTNHFDRQETDKDIVVCIRQIIKICIHNVPETTNDSFRDGSSPQGDVDNDWSKVGDSGGVVPDSDGREAQRADTGQPKQ
jgi:hypothetical protein